MKRPLKVVSRTLPIHLDLEWRREGQFSHFDLAGIRYQMGPCGTVETTHQGRSRDFADIAEALAYDFWEIEE